MKMAGLAVTMGIGAAVGAVAILMAPRQSTARKLAGKAAAKVEDTARDVTTKLEQALDSM